MQTLNENEMKAVWAMASPELKEKIMKDQQRAQQSGQPSANDFASMFGGMPGGFNMDDFFGGLGKK